jgi:hypothetical protein
MDRQPWVRPLASPSTYVARNEAHQRRSVPDVDAVQVDKYRPRNVNEVASQQEVVATLKRALETANVRCAPALPHAPAAWPSLHCFLVHAYSPTHAMPAGAASAILWAARHRKNVNSARHCATIVWVRHGTCRQASDPSSGSDSVVQHVSQSMTRPAVMLWLCICWSAAEPLGSQASPLRVSVVCLTVAESVTGLTVKCAAALQPGADEGSRHGAERQR